MTKICANTQGMQISFEQLQDVSFRTSADLPAQLWSTFDIVERCIARTREYIDLLILARKQDEFDLISSPNATIKIPVEFR